MLSELNKKIKSITGCLNKGKQMKRKNPSLKQITSFTDIFTTVSYTATEPLPHSILP
jgi:hypothetical protein